jgi:cysteine synthase A
MVFRLLHEEGVFVGGSAGLNVCGAVELAKQLGPGHTIVTVLCDSGFRSHLSLLPATLLPFLCIPAPAVPPYVHGGWI